MIYTTVTIALVLLVWGIFKAAKHVFIEGERFLLTEVTISPEPSPESFLNYYSLTRLTGLDCGVSIFSYDIGEIKESLESRPEIKSAVLRKRLPGTVMIEIDERVPVAKLTSEGKELLVDSEGYCFQSRLTPSHLIQRLPIIIPLYGHDAKLNLETQHLTDMGLQRAIHLATRWHEYDISDALLSVEVKNYHSLEVVLESGSALLFGYYEHERQIQDFCSLQSHCETTGQQIVSANLLPYKNIPVKFNKASTVPRRAITPKIYSSPQNQAEPRQEDDVLLILEQG